MKYGLRKMIFHSSLNPWVALRVALIGGFVGLTAMADAGAEVVRQVLVRSGDVLPGTITGLGEISEAAQNSRGDVVFAGRGESVQFAGVWVVSETGVRVELISGGVALPADPAVVWAFGEFARFRSVDINDSRQIVAIGRVAGAGVGNANDNLIVRRSGGVNSGVFREGDLAPGAGGEGFDFFQFALISRTDEGPVVVGGDTTGTLRAGIWSWQPTGLGGDEAMMALSGEEVAPAAEWNGLSLVAFTSLNQAVVTGSIDNSNTLATISKGVYAIAVGTTVPLQKFSLFANVPGIVPPTPGQSVLGVGVGPTGDFAYGLDLPVNPVMGVLLLDQRGAVTNASPAGYADAIPGGPWSTTGVFPFMSLNSSGDVVFRPGLKNVGGTVLFPTFVRFANGTFLPAYYPGQVVNLDGENLTVTTSLWIRNAMSEDGSAVARVSTTDGRTWLVRTSVDATPPVVAISGRKVRKIPSRRKKMPLLGTAVDVGTVVRVEVKVGRRDYQIAQGTDAWRFVVRQLRDRRTVVRVRAFDADEQVSSEARVRIVKKRRS